MILTPQALNFLWQESVLHGIQEDRLPEGDFGIDLGSEFAQQFQRAAIALVAVLAGHVEVAPVGVDLGQEVGSGAEILPVEELVLAQPMHRLHVAVESVSGGWTVGLNPWGTPR